MSVSMSVSMSVFTSVFMSVLMSVLMSLSMNGAFIIISRSIVLNTIVWVTVHVVLIGFPFEESLAFESKHQVTSPKLAAL